MPRTCSLSPPIGACPATGPVESSSRNCPFISSAGAHVLAGAAAGQTVSLTGEQAGRDKRFGVHFSLGVEWRSWVGNVGRGLELVWVLRGSIITWATAPSTRTRCSVGFSAAARMTDPIPSRTHTPVTTADAMPRDGSRAAGSGNSDLTSVTGLGPPAVSSRIARARRSARAEVRAVPDLRGQLTATRRRTGRSS
jgi:hypothetical protein